MRRSILRACTSLALVAFAGICLLRARAESPPLVLPLADQARPPSTPRPEPGLYLSAPWTIVIKAPVQNAPSMPVVTPPEILYSGRAIEPPFLLVPRSGGLAK